MDDAAIRTELDETRPERFSTDQSVRHEGEAGSGFTDRCRA